MKPSRFAVFAIVAGIILAAYSYGMAWVPKPIAADALVRMPGTQPDQGVSIEGPGRCFNCHAGYNTAVEPGFNWRGSMMAQASRDFIFWSCLTVAAQDSIWAIGTPNAVDLCERCHFPSGWLGGRSDPPDVSAMTGSDYDGVHCDFCHQLYDPFYQDTYTGNREGSDWSGYWDETGASSTPSQAAADATRAADSTLAQSLMLFDGSPFFGNQALGSEYPFSFPAYNENGSGQYFASGASAKRASFADANAKHQMLYSRYHKSRYFCGTCHDVSNPALKNLGHESDVPLPTEENPAYSYFHVERTFSEFMLSDYGQQGGTAGIGPFAPGVFETSLASNNISKCQDCHMRDVVGTGCNKSGVPIRPTGSTEHPNSGMPLHDLTGGNAFVGYVLASAVAGSPNYDAVNAALLGQGPAALTLDLTQGMGLDPTSLIAASDRARQQLALAASINNATYNPTTGELSFRIQNQTGHKLISGFPEGRRMFVNIKAYSGVDVSYEVNPFDNFSGTLKGLPKTYSPNSPGTGPGEQYVDSLVYEVHPSSSLTGEDETFHFVLADGRHKDNRIPPKGFRIAEAAARVSVPVDAGVDAPDYFTTAEYAGGYDDVTINIATGADSVEITLYYQTTSREYMEFLRDEINGVGGTLPGTGAGGDAAYLAQTDPFFSGLSAWGDTIWQLWKHNMNVPGAAPVEMAQAYAVVAPGGCTAPAPTLTGADAELGQVTVFWTDEHTSDSNVAGYRVYYDQAGKSQLVADVGLVTQYTDTGLFGGQNYCYKVSSYYSPDCESPPSNILCATALHLTLSPDSPSPATVGDTVLWTASVPGGTGSYEYKFWLRNPAGTWSVAQNYSAQNTWSWNTSGISAGVYRVVAYVRTVGSTSTYDAIEFVDYTLEGGSGPAIITDLVIDSAPMAGVMSTWTATATPGSEFRFWVKDPSGTWSMKQPYSLLNTFEWTPAVSGIHQVLCQVRTAGTTVSFDDYLNSGNVYVAPNLSPAVINTLTPDAPNGTVSAPATITWTANEFTDLPAYEYRWWVHNGVSWSLVQDYLPSNTFGMSAPTSGTYRVICQVRNTGSSAAYEDSVNSGPYVVQ